MNITKTLIARIEDYRATNKKPCKSYATEAKAEAAAESFAPKYAKHFAIKQDEDLIFLSF
jgi:hypothetical protein